jgi:hypothetical protein
MNQFRKKYRIFEVTPRAKFLILLIIFKKLTYGFRYRHD